MADAKKLYPLGFEPIIENGNEVSEQILVADLGYLDSTVSSGWLSGSTIGEIMETYMDRIVGDYGYYFYGRQFPITVKIREVKGDEALMVCPDDVIAEERWDALGKKKLWYILENKEGSELYLGFRKDVSSEDFYNRCKNGSVKDILNVFRPEKGERFLIRPGEVHCATKGMVILEISEASHLDLKLCTWGNSAENDELNLEAAFDFINYSRFERADKNLPANNKMMTRYACEPEFTVDFINLTEKMPLDSINPSYRLFVCLSGESVLNELAGKSSNKYTMKAGEVLLCPSETELQSLEPQGGSASLFMVSLGNRSDADAYIDPSVEAELDGEDYSRAEDDLDDLIDRDLALRIGRTDNYS